MSGIVDRNIPPPDGIDPKVSGWINDSSGNDAVGIAEIRRILLGLNRKGSWTPTITFATPGDLSVAYSVQQGESRRSGRYMKLWMNLTCVPTFTTAAGGLKIGGIPRAIANNDSNYRPVGAAAWQGITNANYSQLVSMGLPGETVLRLFASASGKSNAFVAAADIPTGGSLQLILEIEYRF